MAGDNFTANPGAGGDTFAADDVAGVKIPYSKIDFGDDGVSSPVTAANPLPTSVLTEGTHFQPGYDLAQGVGAPSSLLTDPDGNLVVRGQVLTDEGSYRVNFANSSLAVAVGTATFTNGSTTVTGSGFLAADVRSGDYIKLNADAETAWVQIDTLNSDTSLVLVSAYTGTGGNGACSRAIVKPSTGAGGSIAVASGVCTITSGTTTGSISEIERDVDWLPLVKQAGVTVSQRIANQSIYVGFYDESTPTAPKWYAWFLLDGTTNTTVKCQSARNPTSSPVAAEIEETAVTIPNGLTSATSQRYRVEVMGDRVCFYVNSVLVATHYKSMPGPGDLLTSTVLVVNGTAPASTTTITIDYDSCQNHNIIKAGLLSDSEQIVAVSAPLQQLTYGPVAGVITINTDLMVIDCSQFRSVYVQCSSLGTTGVVTPQWCNEPTFAVPIAASSINETGGVLTTWNTAVLRTFNVMARYLRIRLTTATTAGTTTINAWGSQTPYAPSTVLQAVQGSASVARIGFTAAPGVWYDDNSTVLAAGATFTGTSRDLTVAATTVAWANAQTYAKEVRVSAESDQAGTLWVEFSRDNATWRRCKSSATAAITGGAQFAEIIFSPSWRYIRVGYTNGATLQGRFTIGSITIAN